MKTSGRNGIVCGGCALDYCLRALCFLARDENIVSSSVVSSETGIPRDYLIQLMQPMRQMGLVAARSGKGGGYYLDSDPGEVSVAQVLEALGGVADQGKLGREAKVVNDKVFKCLETMTLLDLMSENGSQVVCRGRTPKHGG